MSSVHHLVSPKLPTTLANQSHVDIPGYDMWFIYVPVVYAVPTKLDVHKFKEALSRVLQLYPHVTGVLQHTDGRWSIQVTNEAITVDIDYRPNVSSRSVLDGEWVVQDDLSLIVNQLQVGNPNLFSIKLTYFDDETCIGVSWHHSLGDAIIIHRFMHTLSQFYQGLDPEFAAPTFEKQHFSPPSRSIAAKFSSQVPRVLELSHIGEDTYAELYGNVVQVKWRFDNHSLEELCSMLHPKGQNGTFLSKQDCLIAYVTAVLNHSRNTVIRTVRSVFSYRNVSAPFISANVASNLLLSVPAAVPTDMAGIAAAVRNSFTQCRQTEYIHGWVSLANNTVLEAANNGKVLIIAPEGDEITANSLARLDPNDSHFGCPKRTRFHINPMFGMYRMRIFKSNPERGDDGVWRTRQSLDVSFGVPVDLKPKILDTLSRGIRYMVDKERARL